MSDISKGQVCDRCRQKKIKCDRDASMQACSNCATAEVACEVSTKLRRNTKIRGYSTTSAEQATISRLETENAELRNYLEAERQVSQKLRRDVELANQTLSTSRPSKLRKIRERSTTPQSPVVSMSGESELSRLTRSSFVIKHMGRMVFDQWNVGRFAGSTTGVHFVASVEALCRQLCPALRPFPEDCFRMHLLQQSNSIEDIPMISELEEAENIEYFSLGKISQLMAYPLAYYATQLDLFNETWMAFCPVVPHDQFLKHTEELLEHMKLCNRLSGKFASTLQALVAIILVNRLSLAYGEDLEPEESITTRKYLSLACQLHGQVIARGDLYSLQALVLFSFYLQLSGMTPWLVQVNGLQLRLAQSLGMHRHARRFRFTDSETELRKRMWWWIYSFDKVTSIVHGLPQLISDSDVDNDLPIDCELGDLGPTGLTHPLPGEASPVALYIHYIQLHKILSTVLDQLYTTSQRRGGEEKINRLDRALRNFYQNLNSALQPTGPSLEIGDVDQARSKSRLQRFSENETYMIAWLDIMSNYTMVLIHRPALTFDKTTHRFQQSLDVCLKASLAIMQLATSSHFYRRMLDSAPFGAKLVFQSALMPVFNRCVLQANSLEDTNLRSNDHATISNHIKLLTDMEADLRYAGIHGRVSQDAIQLLQSISREVFGSAGATYTPPVRCLDVQHQPSEWNQSQSDHIDDPAVFPHMEMQSNIDFNMWNTSALDSLNQLDTFFGTWEDNSEQLFSHHLS